MVEIIWDILRFTSSIIIITAGIKYTCDLIKGDSFFVKVHNKTTENIYNFMGIPTKLTCEEALRHQENLIVDLNKEVTELRDKVYDRNMGFEIEVLEDQIKKEVENN